ncbi:MAG: UDP-N-acetylglucosamine 1-carboxyvinyltransferase, partial [bacterium]
IRNVIPRHLNCISSKLEEMGVEVIEGPDCVLVRRFGPLRRTNLKTQPYPGFPTDMQPQLTTVLTLARGTSLVTEGVWDNRYKYCDELAKMGASIRVEGRSAIVQGVAALTGAHIKAHDLRAGAAMVIAGLCAEGTTEIEGIEYIERGYEEIVEKLRAVGADIVCVQERDPVQAANAG